MTLRLVQLRNGDDRRVAIVEEPLLRLIAGYPSVHALATAALHTAQSLTALARQHAGDDTLNYDEIYHAASPWKLLVPFDHPDEPARCLVSGTGLTHLGSAKNRQAMHGGPADETDSMKMFRWGVEGGRPDPGQIGAPPEWFFKGTGVILRACGQPLEVPPYADDGGEEAEIAGVYLVDKTGHPHRVGMAIGNEFSDHRFEKKNYLNLAGSKVRTCSLGPELVIGAEFQSVHGQVQIDRGGKTIWCKPIATGAAEMCHSLSNIEHHHFKFASHRRPGDAHVHYFGAHSLSFGDGITLADGDEMVISFDGFGRPLRNSLRVDGQPDSLLTVGVLG